jgi:hypothetical protein
MTAEIRLGIIVPSVNIVVERWYPSVLPDGVAAHFARMLLADRGGPAARDRLWLHRVERGPRPRI